MSAGGKLFTNHIQVVKPHDHFAEYIHSTVHHFKNSIETAEMPRSSISTLAFAAIAFNQASAAAIAKDSTKLVTRSNACGGPFIPTYLGNGNSPK